MATKGFLHDPINDINQLQQLLRDRYHRGFPVIKELLQNADDARATECDFGYVSALGGSPRHPLLRGPGLFVVNDGPFTADNAEAIRFLGLSNKPATDTATGKFGLGLKSIFHLCEAFFFLASPDAREDDRAARRGHSRTDVFNPYSSPRSGWHPDWDDFDDADRTLLRSTLGPLLRDDRPWFCLWIPLRRGQQLAGRSPIQRAYPEPDEILGAGHLPYQVAHVMPMLRHLRRVREWGDRTPGAAGAARPRFEVRLEDGDAVRRSLPSNGRPGGRELRGRLTVARGGGGDEKIRFAGHELLLADDRLAALSAHDGWPTICTFSDTGERQQLKQGASQHAAVLICEPAGRDRAPGAFGANWSVTLPIGDESFVGGPPAAGGASLTLHGHFFVDAGRLGIEFGDEAADADLPSDERAVQQAWNRRLRDVGVLPTLVPSLVAMADACRGDGEPADAVDDRMRALTADVAHALAKVAAGRASRAAGGEAASDGALRHVYGAVCRDLQWVRRLGVDGPAWTTVAADAPVYEIDLGDASPSDAFGRLPGLGTLARAHVFVAPDAPRLTRDARARAWTAELTLAALDALSARRLAEAATLSLLVRVLRASATHVVGVPAVARRLVAVANAATTAFLACVDPAERSRLREPLVRLLELLPDDRVLRLSIDSSEPSGARLAAAVLGAASQILPLPADLCPPRRRVAEPSLEDVGGCLEALAKLAVPAGQDGAAFIAARSACAVEILGAAGPRAAEARARIAPLKLWNVRSFEGALDAPADGRSARAGAGTAAMSVDELERPSGHVLFRDADDRGLAGAVQAAVRAGSRVMLLDRAAAPLLFPELQGCTERECIRRLASGALPLAAATRRAGLLERLLPALRDAPSSRGADDADADFRGLRYLLHGLPEHLEDDGPLLRGDAGSLGAAWGKLLDAALAAGRERWRAVDPALASLLSDRHGARLRVGTVSRRSVAELLARGDARSIDCSAITASEARRVLAEFPGLDEPESAEAACRVLRDLCIHPVRGADGTVAPRRIDVPGAFLDDPRRAFPVEAELLRDATVLLADDDAAVQARQAKLAPRLDGAAVIELALGHPTPQRFWRTMLRALPPLFASPVSPLPESDPQRPALPERLRDVAWLPSRTGAAVGCRDAIHLGKLEAIVGPFLAEAGKRWPSLERRRLSPDVLEADGFATLRERLLPPRAAALESLGRLLAAHEPCRIGDFDPASLDLKPWLRLFADATDEAMPTRPLLAALSEELATEDLLAFVAHLAKSPGTARLVQILNHLSGQPGAGAEPASDGAVDEAGDEAVHHHDLYLAMLAEAVDRNDRDAVARFRTGVLPRLRLLNRKHEWCAPDRLCLDVPGLDPAYLLDEEQGELLEGLAASDKPADKVIEASGNARPVDPTEFAAAARRSDEAVVAYLRQWSSHVPPGAIGLLLCAMGVSPRLRNEAQQRYLGGRTADGLLDQLTIAAGRALADRSARDAIRGRELLVDLVRPAVRRELNLLGTHVDAAVQQAPTQLLVGNPQAIPRTLGSPKSFRLQWLQLQPAALGPAKALEVLRETARQVLARVTLQNFPNFDDVWIKVTQKDQLDVEVTQDVMLDHAPQYLRQLRTGELGAELTRALNDLLDARYASREARSSANPAKAHADAEQRVARARETLIGALKSNATVQRKVVRALRERVADMQYAPASIPFELFQNADDAVVEREQVEASSPAASGPGQPGQPRASACRAEFHVEEGAGRLTFLHWGRPINYPHRTDPEARERGYHRDLEKMLTLSQSDKPADAAANPLERTTGKFGLGFKSVFLVCDRPRVVSRWLGFEVVGGLYPVRLGPDALESLRSKLIAHGDAEGTAIDLRLTEGMSPGAVLARFRELARYLVIFARRLRTCRFAGPGGASAFAWSPRGVPGASGVEWGELASPGRADGSAAPAKVLVLGRDASAAVGELLVPLGEFGLGSLPPDVPTVWATAPTTHCERVGFAVNGPFELDPGRMQLAADPADNRVRAEALGRSVGAALVSLFDASADWPRVRQALGLRGDATREGFWWSIWERFAATLHASRSDAAPAVLLLRRALWSSPHQGMFALLAQRPALPTGCGGPPYERLVAPADVRWRTGTLLSDAETFEVAMGWESFRAAFPPGRVVAGRIADALGGLSEGVLLTDGTAATLTMAAVVGAEVGQLHDVPAASAARLGRLVGPEFLRSAAEKSPIEEGELRELLERLSFQTAAGGWAPAGELVIATAGDDKEEALRAAFAPAEYRLHPAYQGEAIAFFKACRRRMRTEVGELAAWAVAAADEPARQAVLRYLRDGAMRRELAAALHERGEASWTNARAELEALVEDEFDRMVVQGMLKVPVDDRPAAATRFKGSPAALLGHVHAWWRDEGPRWVEWYERELYGGAPPDVNADDPHVAREAWMTLFVYGVTHTVGAIGLGHARAFVQRCRQSNWMAVFAAGEHRPEDWMNILESFLDSGDGDLTHYHWLRQLPAIFQMSRWLDAYRECLLQLRKVKSPVALDQFLDPNANEGFSGAGGLRAPPMTKPLGMGACYALRELVRLGRLANPRVHEHCYPLPERVRDLLTRMGCEGLSGVSREAKWPLSRDAYRFLASHLGAEAATFGGCFDLPLLVLADARHEALRAAVLRQ